MWAHLRVNLFLLVFTLLFCSVLYPLVVLGIGQTVFRDKAQGSLVRDAQGNAVGSRLIAQPFGGDEYFQPRPSAANYNGAASAASNWGASNPLLRDRVARTLGPIVKYKGTPPHGRTVQEDVKEWFRNKPDPVTDWATAHEGVAQAWVNADDKHKAAVTGWQKTPEGTAAAEWKKNSPGGGEPKPADLAAPFFKSKAREYHENWPELIDDASWSVEAVFFDAWLQENPQAALEEVPADMVTASGSGLDPHITLKNALYQLDRVAGKWAELTKRDAGQLREEIDEDILNKKAEAPGGGLFGVKLVNVLEVNLALRERYAAAGGKVVRR